MRRAAGGPEAFDGVVGATSYLLELEDSLAAAKAFNDPFRKAHDGGGADRLRRARLRRRAELLTAVRMPGASTPTR